MLGCLPRETRRSVPAKQGFTGAGMLGLGDCGIEGLRDYGDVGICLGGNGFDADAAIRGMKAVAATSRKLISRPLAWPWGWPRTWPWRGPEEDARLRANREYFRSFSQDKPLTEYEFVVFDTELTGLNERRDELVSIGAVRIREMRLDLQNCFYTCIRPDQCIPKTSTLIHRITPGQGDEAPGLDSVLPEFVSFCGQALLVGHNVGLDIGFVNRALQKNLGGRLHNPCLDTMRLAMLYKETQWENYYDRYNLNVSYSLGDLSREYGLPLFEEHNALQDAMQTAYLFLFFVHKLHGGKIKTLRDLFLAGKNWRWI